MEALGTEQWTWLQLLSTAPPVLTYFAWPAEKYWEISYGEYRLVRFTHSSYILSLSLS